MSGEGGTRRKRFADPRVAWLAGLLAFALIAWGSFTYLNSRLRTPTCGTPAVLQVAAAPAIADALADIARDAPDAKSCYRVEVVARESGALADALSNPAAEALPQVWVPESTFWLRRARAKGAFQVADRATSVATTPVVFALTEAVARQLGWPGQPVQWSSLVATNSTVTLGMPDPASDPIGVSGVIGVRAATAGEPDPGAANVAALRRISANTLTREADLYQRLSVGAFVSSEQALLTYNARRLPTQLVAAYARPAVPGLDFPFAVLPGAGDADRAAATRFLNAVLAPAGRLRLAADEFRSPEGVLGPSAPVPASGSQSSAPAAMAPLPDENDLVQVLTAWTGVHLSARILGALDISGSMAEKAPTGKETRLSATISAMQQGVGLLRETTEVGFWVFSTKLEGDRDYRVLAPVRPLSEGKSDLLAALASVKVKPDGDTGLYDTALAAYQDARHNWVPGRINVVLIATDGKNDDPGGITRQQLLAELAKLNDPSRPLPILFIGIGGGIDRAELNEIAGATGGRVYLSNEPSGIKSIFFSALSDLTCQPPACKR